jgi:hypothetical protein
MSENLVPQYLQTPVLAVISPQSASAGTYTSGWVAMAAIARAYAVLSIGAITGSGTVNAKFQQASDSSGTGAKDVTGAAMTEIVGSANSNEQVTIEVRQAQLDVANNFTHVRLSVTTAVAASLISAVIQGNNAKYAPLAQAASVAESVAG